MQKQNKFLLMQGININWFNYLIVLAKYLYSMHSTLQYVMYSFMLISMSHNEN